MSTKFWIEDISQLFSGGITPRVDQTIDANLNAISRLALLACAILMLIKPIVGVSTFCIMMVIIMTIYYSKEKPREQYTNLPPTDPVTGVAHAVVSPTERYLCADKRSVSDDPCEYVSINQRLVGPPNPKTLLPLMDVTKNRSHDLDTWKASDFTVHSMINDQVPVFDVYTAGYTQQNPYTPCRKCSRSACSCIMSTAAMRMVDKRDSGLADVFDTSSSGSTGGTVNSGNIPILSADIKTDDFLEDVVDIIENPFDMSSIVDPRFSGYGPTDRCYYEPITGQTRFAYDDVNAVKMPNYVSRNAIDVYPWAPKYGSGYDGSDRSDTISTLSAASSNRGLLDIRQNAIDAFTTNTSNARQELQTRLMSKRNGEMWQRRIAPIY